LNTTAVRSFSKSLDPAPMRTDPPVFGAGRNVALQSLRGLAAASVMLYHAAHFSAERTHAVWLENAFSGRFGLYGVLVFFVLSGFLMEAAVRTYDARTFLLHRFVRLYPTYWMLFLGLYFVQSIRGGALQAVPWSSLTLLPLGEMYRPLAVEWTLLYEVFFYAICALLCFWRKAQPFVLLVWVGVVAIAVFRYSQYGSTYQPTLLQIPFSVWNVGFISGGLAGYVNRKIRTVDTATLILAGLALVFLGELLNPAAKLFLAGPGIACSVIALVRTRTTMSSAGLGVRALFMLGEYSYGLYLVHSLSIQIALQYVPDSILAEPVSVFAGMIGVGLCAGIVAGRMDIALYRSLKTWVDTRIRAAEPEPQAA
jgi:exopolysaccharide production protein ExoZ